MTQGDKAGMAPAPQAPHPPPVPWGTNPHRLQLTFTHSSPGPRHPDPEGGHSLLPSSVALWDVLLCSMCHPPNWQNQCSAHVS